MLIDMYVRSYWKDLNNNMYKISLVGNIFPSGWFYFINNLKNIKTNIVKKSLELNKETLKIKKEYIKHQNKE